MGIQKDKSYIITIDINDKILTYTCKITDIEEQFVSFIDKFGQKYTFNKNLIMSAVEIEEDENDSA